MSEDKRIISLGLIRPSGLDEDTIYIDFKYDEGYSQVSAVAYSNKEFKCHKRALAGNILCKNTKKVTTYTGSGKSSWHQDYNQFIEDLAKSNNGEVTKCRLIKDGSSLVAKTLHLREDISKTKFQDFYSKEI